MRWCFSPPGTTKHSLNNLGWNINFGNFQNPETNNRSSKMGVNEEGISMSEESKMKAGLPDNKGNRFFYFCLRTFNSAWFYAHPHKTLKRFL
jgi:hypothetical protein